MQNKQTPTVIPSSLRRRLWTILITYPIVSEATFTRQKINNLVLSSAGCSGPGSNTCPELVLNFPGLAFQHNPCGLDLSGHALKKLWGFEGEEKCGRLFGCVANTASFQQELRPYMNDDAAETCRFKCSQMGMCDEKGDVVSRKG